MSLLCPTLYETDIYRITAEKLKELNISLVILDIDNTLVPTNVEKPPKKVVDWINDLKNNNITVVVASNNKKTRVAEFCNEAELFFTYRSGKPLTYAFYYLKKKFDVKRNEMCIIGDQLYMDILGANIFGMKSILVHPISKVEGLGVRLRRYFEILPLKSIRSKKLALIGDPVDHSISKVLHTKVFEKYNINADYEIFNPKAEELEKFISYFKQNDYLGFNVTTPYKTEIIKYLDVVSEKSQKLNSVNTVKIVNGKLYGYTTDGDGFCLNNKELIKDAKIKLIGLGAAGKSIAVSLIENGAKEIIIYNRTLAKAEEFAKEYENVSAKALSEFKADDCDILINTSSKELTEEEPIVNNLNGIRKETVVFDILYNKPETNFIKMANEKGCKTINGREMLINQGVLSDVIWFSK